MLCGALIALLLFFGGMPCYAEQDTEAMLYDAAESIRIPEEAEELFDDTGISLTDPESFLALSPGEMFRAVLQKLSAEAAAPLRLCGTLMAVTMLSVLLGSMGDTAGDPALRRLFDTLCTLLCVGAAAVPICACLNRTAEALQTGRIFMGSYIPVFAAFLAAGGAVAGAASYQVFLLFLTEVIMQIANGILFPLLQMTAALGLADAVNPKVQLSGFVSAMRTAVTWTLGFIMTMFSALLTVRSFVADAADSLAAKSLKLIASSAIPVVGGAVSDAYATVQGSIRLLRSGVGAAGILVILWLILPPLLSLALYRAVFSLMRIFADMAGAKQMSQLYQNAGSVLAAAFAVLVCFGVMLIFSSALMMLLVKGESL